VFNEPTPESDPELPPERPYRPAVVDPQTAARARCDRPGLEGGISFWDLLEARRGDLIKP
jgi:hypothetical protein